MIGDSVVVEDSIEEWVDDGLWGLCWFVWGVWG